MNDIVRIVKVTPEGAGVTTILFEWNGNARPGQFVMVWRPGMEEIPLSLSLIDGDVKGITFKAIGDDTKKLAESSVGDRLRIRGAFGNGYDVGGKKILLVGGGIGIAPLLPLVRSTGADIALAARNKDELAYGIPVAKEFASNHWISTDDGSLGLHGNAGDLVKSILSERSYDEIIACGPEVMLFFLFKYCRENGIKCQMSLERYMKCGCGGCGACMIDKKRVCADGPVFTGDEIASMKEFFNTSRDASGTIKRLR